MSEVERAQRDGWIRVHHTCPFRGVSALCARLVHGKKKSHCKMFRTAVRLLTLVLGLFEFFMVYRLIFDAPETMQAELSFYPRSFFEDDASKYAIRTFTAFLGLLRFIWATGNNSFLSWLGIVTAHVVEVIFLWNLARLPHFDTQGSENFLELVKKVQAGSVGQPSVNFILFFVPFLLLLLILHGPGSWKKKKSGKTKNE